MKKWRYYFESCYDRINFFNNILRNNNLSLRRLSLKIKILKSSAEKYYSGKQTLPEEVFSKLVKMVKNKEKEYFASKIRKIKDGWGQRKGGLTTYSRHPELYDKARQIAVIKKREERIKAPVSLDLCEFIGAFIGDGFMNKYGNMHITQFTGDLRLDKEYYYSKIIPK